MPHGVPCPYEHGYMAHGWFYALQLLHMDCSYLCLRSWLLPLPILYLHDVQLYETTFFSITTYPTNMSIFRDQPIIHYAHIYRTTNMPIQPIYPYLENNQSSNQYAHIYRTTNMRIQPICPYLDLDSNFCTWIAHISAWGPNAA